MSDSEVEVKKGADEVDRKHDRDEMFLNDSKIPELRGRDDLFGRHMTIFWKKHTKGDTEPLAVTAGEPYRLPTAVYL